MNLRNPFGGDDIDRLWAMPSARAFALRVEPASGLAGFAASIAIAGEQP